MDMDAEGIQRPVAASPQLAGYLQAVPLRHQHVEDERVRGRRGDGAEGLLAVGRQLDVVALELERAFESPPELRLVVDDQYSHVLMLSKLPKSMMRAAGYACTPSRRSDIG
jgi:hypothetical protein